MIDADSAIVIITNNDLGRGQGQRSVFHMMHIAMGYDFASLTFDLDGQLKGEICHFVMKFAI